MENINKTKKNYSSINQLLNECADIIDEYADLIDPSVKTVNFDAVVRQGEPSADVLLAESIEEFTELIDSLNRNPNACLGKGWRMNFAHALSLLDKFKASKTT